MSTVSVLVYYYTNLYSCVAAAKYGPDPTAAVNNGILPKSWATNPVPVKTFVGTPPAEYQQTDANLFAAKFNGINSMVCKYTLTRCLYAAKKLTESLDAYSGALLFVAFLSEMRQPLDFWKAVFLAQAFITVVYVFFGAFVSQLSHHIRPKLALTNFRPTPTTASTATLPSPRLSSHSVSKC